MAKAGVTHGMDLAHQRRRCENQDRLSVPGWGNSMRCLTPQSWWVGVGRADPHRFLSQIICPKAGRQEKKQKNTKKQKKHDL